MSVDGDGRAGRCTINMVDLCHRQRFARYEKGWHVTYRIKSSIYLLVTSSTRLLRSQVPSPRFNINKILHRFAKEKSRLAEVTSITDWGTVPHRPLFASQMKGTKTTREHE